MMEHEAEDAHGMTAAQEQAARAIDPCATSSQIVATFRAEDEAAIDMAHGQAAMRERVEEVRKGAFDGAGATMVGQAAALNAIFAHMARRAHAHLDRPGKSGERYLRLALRAQAQCRATLNAVAGWTGRLPEEAPAQPQYNRIERVIVYPPERPGDEERVVPY